MKDLVNLFRWQDILDILILTFVFYRLYLWLRRKRALKMVLAILGLPFFYVVAQWIDLPLSVWILQNVWSVVLLVLVVIFQQEIRGVLGSINLPGFFLGRSEAVVSQRADKIAPIPFRMAAEGIGGLIVLQRRDDLDEFIHEKTPLDAEIHEDLILSLFHAASPLHDGAIVLQGDRIRYAGAVLPVSPSTSFPKQWGTRHRAGAGITEVSDAECIVISEERREVLYANAGKVEAALTPEELRRKIAEPPFSREKEAKGQGPLGWVFADFPRKAFFLLLVCLLWVFVIAVRQGEVSFTIPVEYYSIPETLALTGETPREINVRLRGSQRLLSSLKMDHLRVQIDLSSSHPGGNPVFLSETNIQVPSGIIVTSFYPRRILVQLTPIPRSNRK